MKFGMFLIGDNSPDLNRNEALRPKGRGALFLFRSGLLSSIKNIPNFISKPRSDILTMQVPSEVI